MTRRARAGWALDASRPRSVRRPVCIEPSERFLVLAHGEGSRRVGQAPEESPVTGGPLRHGRFLAACGRKVRGKARQQVVSEKPVHAPSYSDISENATDSSE